MTLNELHEMAFKAGEWKFKPDISVLTNLLKDGVELTKLEDGKLRVLNVDDKFGLFKDDILLSFAQLENRTLHDVQYRSVVAIFTPEENRRNGYSSILLFALKELNNTPLLFDDAIFDNGWSLLQSIAKNHNTKFQSIRTLNKDTGEITDFSGLAPKKSDAFIVENDAMGFYRDTALGRVYFNMFE